MHFLKIKDMRKQVILKEWDRETPTHHIHCVKVESICWCCNGTGEHQDSGDRDVNDYIDCHRCYARDLESSCEGTVRCLECKGTGKIIRINTEKRAKYLCIGGPHHLTWKTKPQLGEGYTDYNNASYSKKVPKVVMIFEDILNTPKADFIVRDVAK